MSICLLGGIQYLYTSVLFPKNFRHRSWVQLQETLVRSNNHLSYLILGDSIAQNAINPTYLSGYAFNYAFQGENVMTTAVKLDALFEQGVDIDYVVLELGLGRFNTDRVDDKRHGENLFYLYHVVGEPLAILVEPYEDKLATALQTRRPILGSGRMWGYLLQATTLDMEQGWIAHDEIWDGAEKTSSDTEIAKLFEITGLARQALQDIFAMIAAHESKLVLLIYPQGNKSVSGEDRRKKQYIQEIATLAGESINTGDYLVLDYYDLLDGCVSCFIDGGHANTSGATLISQQLARDFPLY